MIESEKTMEINDIITLIKAVSNSSLTAFEYQEGDARLSFQAERAVKTTAWSGVPEGQPAVLDIEKDERIEKCITSPMVGTFYRAPSEGADPYVNEGDAIKKGQIIGIVEAMKLMNEIESPYDGIVGKIYAGNQEMVGYGQNLMQIL